MLIEEAEGLSNAAEIARSSDRLEAIIFGAGDLSASLHARVDGNFDPVGEYPGDFWHHARVQILAAARAAGIDAIDAPYPAYQDPEGYRRSAGHASLLGYDGKWAIHPGQVPIANEVFAPTEAEVRDAEESIATYRASEADGVGRHRSGRAAGGRRPHATGRQRAAQGRARGLRTGRDRDRDRGGPPTYRVVQWATGNIGSRALRAVIEHPRLDLVGVRVTNPDKVGRDAGALCGTGPGRRGRHRRPRRDPGPGTRTACSTCSRGTTSTCCARCSGPGVNVVTTTGGFHHPGSMDADGARTASRRPVPTGGTSIHCHRGQPGVHLRGDAHRPDLDPAPTGPPPHRRVRRPVEPRLPDAALRPHGIRQGARPPSTRCAGRTAASPSVPRSG